MRICLAILLFALQASAQPAKQWLKPNDVLPSTDTLRVLQYAQQWIPSLQRENVQLKISSTSSSTRLHHSSFDVWYNEVYCWQSTVKVNVSPAGKVHSVKLNLPDWFALSKEYDDQIVHWQKIDTQSIVGANRMVKQQRLVWYPPQGLRWAVSCWSLTSDYTLLFNQQGRICDSISHERRFGRDTFVHARIFNPDPLTTQGFFYGGNYIDNSDADATWLQPAYRTVKVPATYIPQLGQFALYNNWVSLEEFEAPVFEPVRQANQTFFFNRSESGFEDVMTMYHIMTFRQQLATLGYPQLMNQVLHVDAHAQFGADNSMFVRNGGEPSLRLGTGGVDDAEDADVIIHEYAHGLSWSANNNINFSFERSALDEGLADYWATSYSRRKNAFRWEDVFTWDGHNEFWNGRTASSTQLYPSSGNLYQVGEIWNAVLSKLWSDVGADITDRLQLESMFFYTEQSTLPEAAMYLIEADSLLYNGIHTNIICSRFQQQGILGANCLPLETASITKFISPQLINTMGFAQAVGPLQLAFPDASNGVYQWYAVDGRLLMEGTIDYSLLWTIPPPNYTGLLFLSIQTNQQRFRFPLLRMQ
jgi:hypothetical protein